MSVYYEIKFISLLVFNFSIIIIVSVIVINTLITQNKLNKVNGKYNIALKSLNDYENMMSKYRIVNHENKNLLLTVRAMILNNEKEIPKYIDSIIEKKYIDECGAANFFGIRDNTYITPKSDSILPSITNKCLQALAEHLGMKVECRPVPEEELATFEEAAACGTAAVISPISQIDDPVRGVSYTYTTDGTVGPCCRKLYDLLCAIRKGETEDIFGWNDILD